MMGMLNYRGQVLGVLESASLRGRRNRELSPSEHLIILHVESQLFALRVDQAIEIMTWTDGDERTGKPGSVEDRVDDTLNSIAHPRFGMVSLLDSRKLWSELHFKQSHLPTQEVEAS
jgi:chemotaxis signal transduction protein